MFVLFSELGYQVAGNRSPADPVGSLLHKSL